MPAISTRINTSSQKIDVQRPFSSAPIGAVDLYSGDAPLTRGIPPEQYMYDFDTEVFAPKRPTFRRGFNIINSLNQNLALIAQSKTK